MKKQILALTGGIASGKSTVARLFEQKGIPVCDADQIARDIVEPGTETLEKIVLHFGDDVLLNNGHLNRQALREIIFESPEERVWLEELTHPIIRNTMQDWAMQNPAPICCLMIPLLHDRKTYNCVDKIIVVDTPESTQIKRLMARDHIDEAAAQKILKAQISREQRLALADIVIENQGDEADLIQNVINTIEPLLSDY